MASKQKNAVVKKCYIAVRIRQGRLVTCLGTRATLKAIKELYPSADLYFEAKSVDSK